MNSFEFIAKERERLDKAILGEVVRRGANNSRSELKGWIEGGQVTVNGKVVKKAGLPLVPGDSIAVTILAVVDSTLASYDFPLPVLYEDDDVIVIDKPAGISMHPGAGEKRKTVVNALHKHLREWASDGEVVRPGVVHRLDKDTTGVVVVAKNRHALQQLTQQFSARTAQRAYMALVLVTPRGANELGRTLQGCVDLPIGRHPTQRVKMAVVESGRRAVTHWEVLEAMPFGRLVRVRLETGRTHQIRVHMSHLRAPIIGDTVYGDFSALPLSLKNAADKFGRQALHAFQLGFVHPRSGKLLQFTSNLPEDMEQLCTAFREYGGR